jgi:hypothetical protein
MVEMFSFVSKNSFISLVCFHLKEKRSLLALVKGEEDVWWLCSCALYPCIHWLVGPACRRKRAHVIFPGAGVLNCLPPSITILTQLNNAPSIQVIKAVCALNANYV